VKVFEKKNRKVGYEKTGRNNDEIKKIPAPIVFHQEIFRLEFSKDSIFLYPRKRGNAKIWNYCYYNAALFFPI